MSDLIITVSRDSRKVTFNRGFIGISGENLQGNIVVDFQDKANFINGTATFEVEQNGEKHAILMEKDEANKYYTLPIKSSLLAYACIMKCQVSIEQEATEYGAPKFKTERFNLHCYEAVNAIETIPEQYSTWFDRLTEAVETAENSAESALSYANEAKQYADEAYIASNEKRIEKAENRIDAVEKLLVQSGTVAVLKTEQAYTERQTADGAEIFDEQYTKVTEIKGSTVRYENLIPYPYKDTSGSLLNFPQTVNSVEFTNENGVITVNGTNDKSNSSVWFPFSPYIKVTKGASYYVSGCPVGGGVNKYGILVNIYNAEGNSVGEVYDYGTGLVYTPQEGDEKIVVYIRVYPSGTVNNAKFKPLFKIGTEGQWQPYFTGLKHAKISGIKSTGKNLIPYPYINTSKTMNGITFTVNGDGSVTVNGTATAEAYIYLANSSNMSISAGQYTVSGNSENVTINVRKNNSAWIEDGKTGTFNDGDTFDILGLYVSSGKTVNNVTVYPMFNRGTTALPYEPYTEDIYQLPQTLELGEWDSLKPQTGELTRATGEVVFNGTENWVMTSGTTYPRFSTYVKGTGNAWEDKTKIVSNYYKWGQAGYAGRSCIVVDTNSNLSVEDSKYATVGEWKAHLAELYANGTPLTAAYVLKQPTTETIANAPKSYEVHDHGSETVVQGETDNSKFGAMPTVANEYFIKVGAEDE